MIYFFKKFSYRLIMNIFLSTDFFKIFFLYYFIL